MTQSQPERSDSARANTRATVFYEAACWWCRESPDLDGHEWRVQEEAALDAAIHEANWTLTADGKLTCEDCCAEGRATHSQEVEQR